MKTRAEGRGQRVEGTRPFAPSGVEGPALTILVLAFCACSNPTYEYLPSVKARAVREAFVPPAGLSKLKLGLVPYVSEATMRATHGKLAAHLGRELGVEVETVVGQDYDAVGELLARGELNFAELSPYVYVRAKQRAKLSPLVMAISDGSDTAAGYIVVRRDSGIQRIDELKGKAFGYVDRASATGYLLPRKFLREHGFDLDKDFSSTELLGNHEAVLAAVAEGRVAAGGTYQGALAQARRKGLEPLTFRIIAKTARSPRDLYVARADLPAHVQEAIKRLLLEVTTLTPEGREMLSPMDINGYVPADDRAYADVERAHLLEVGAAQ
jgi:phosphate/phosphite/phosphonate ABC transporter binding protein